MNPQKFYAVGALHKSVIATISGQEISVPISWREGMIGFMPVFESKEAAEVEAGAGFVVVEFGAKEAE